MNKDGLNFWKTNKNNDFLLDAGLTLSDVEDAIRQLTVKEYSSGPKPDDNPKRPIGDVWVFAKEYYGYELYLKLKLLNGNASAQCLSFHEAENTLRTPNRTLR